MVAAVIAMLISTRQAGAEPVCHGIHIVPALVILLREITVSGLREFLASLAGFGAGQRSSPSGRRRSSWSRWAR